MNVVIGTLIYREGAYVLDKYLSNQKEIQQNYPLSELVLATHEADFVEELEAALSFWKLKGRVFFYETEKPAYARSRRWNIASGRERLRSYMLTQTRADYLLSLDADMTFDPSIVNIMEREINGYDVIFNGYPLRSCGLGLAGEGCMMLTRGVLGKIKFRCYEFKNGRSLPVDTILEMDLFRLRSRVKKGFFLSVNHYINMNDVKSVAPRRLGIFRKIMNYPFFRYLLIGISILVHYDIAMKLKVILNRFKKY